MKWYSGIKRIDWEISVSPRAKDKVILSNIDRDHLHSKIKICIECEGPRSILSVVIFWAWFGLYTIKLKANVFLTFHGLIPKLIEVIYTPRQMYVPNLKKLGQFCV